MKKNKKAVTIIETLITLLAITIMLSGPISFIAKSFEYSSFVRGKIIASGFAQEGLELATALRNGENDANFITKITPCLNVLCSIDFDFTNANAIITLSPCNGAGCNLYKNQNEIDSLFRQTLSFSEKTDYSRTITFIPQNTGGYNVKSRVYNIIGDDYLPIDITLEKSLFLFNKK